MPPCGHMRDCGRNYSLADVNASASSSHVYSGESMSTMKQALARKHEHSRKQCLRRDGQLASGGWCLSSDNATLVELPGGGSYRIPEHHVHADKLVVLGVAALLMDQLEGVTKCGRHQSVSDIGAGVGQVGHALHALQPSLHFRGYDGAGNVEEYTDGFISFVDLTMPLSLPRSDWVTSFEVGEHIPAHDESMFIRNLHALNCRGVVVSWAALKQAGFGHVNNHDPQYVRSVFEGLGYRYSAAISMAIRNGSGLPPSLREGSPLLRTVRYTTTPRGRAWWFRHASLQAFERITPSTAPGCKPCPTHA